MRPADRTRGAPGAGIVRRGLLLAGGIVLLFLAVLGRLFYLQVLSAEPLVARAAVQWQAKETLPAKRGTIYDRNGTPLAVDGPAYDVIAVVSPRAPDHVVDPAQTAAALAPHLGMPAARIEALLRQPGRYQVEFRPGGWKISPETKAAIEALHLPGIVFVEDRRRYYPFGAFLAHTLGYVDKEGEARMGLEAALDDVLAGRDGALKLLVDGGRRFLPGGVQDYVPPVDGKDVVLTIDQTIQTFVEDALDAAAEQVRAKHLLAVVANPKTLEVYALASRPHFDPNDYTRITNYLNLPVAFEFEPGSTFKTITLAAAINEGVYNPDETYQAGVYRSKEIRPPIRDWNDVRGWGTIPFRDAFVRSSNVGMTILGYERLGRERLARYYEAFGFGARTGIDLPGEAAGRVPDLRLVPPRDVASTTFGQRIAVTPIQMVAAVSAAINGGTLMRPYVVRSIERRDEGIVYEAREPTAVRRVISPEASARVREAMAAVVESPVGTGRAFAIPGYRIGGKTGTAQKLSPDGTYRDGAYIYSFIGFAPLDDPAVLVYVVVDEPDLPATSSGEVVAPIFKAIMSQTLAYLDIPPEGGGRRSAGGGSAAENGDAPAPDRLRDAPPAGEKRAADQAVPADGTAAGGAPPAAEQGVPPAADRGMPPAGEVERSATPAEEAKGDAPLTVSVPDVRGRSKKEAAALLQAAGLEADFDGTGYAVAQDPAPGSRVAAGTAVRVRFEPPAPPPGASDAPSGSGG
ncbi:penicillin-binding transpeptidase domain-containing protein [Hydrogenibacillus sp. N12]|uniref:penicillin-binding transpeptidase domain-containing protein n=1 Tax=Hydrogenibacillus sp. N12 TaxID=2866627 RepID=UPI001C7CBC60|nr:penicillin-binding transpeptidase domain-containing protein [Hydrogenibacillus sp. N12]QZA33947.1 PASTA domain-containing protein [Hydrogenibacillus sp. N12]